MRHGPKKKKPWLVMRTRRLLFWLLNWIFWISLKISWWDVYCDSRSTITLITSGEHAPRQMELNISSRSYEIPRYIKPWSDDLGPQIYLGQSWIGLDSFGSRSTIEPLASDNLLRRNVRRSGNPAWWSKQEIASDVTKTTRGLGV